MRGTVGTAFQPPPQFLRACERTHATLYYNVKYMLTRRAAWCRLWRHECPTTGSLRGAVARVSDHHVGRCGTRGAPPSRLALCTRPAAGWGTKIDRTAGRARVRRRRAGPAAIRGAESVGVGASPAPVGATDRSRAAAGGGLDHR